MQIKNNILKIVLVSLLALSFSSCDDNESSSTINSEKKVRLPKPEWEDRLTNYKDTGKWFQLADDDEIAAYNIGVIYSEKIKDYNKAIEWYLYSDSINSNGDNLFNIGLIYNESKKYEKAIFYYKKSFSLGIYKSALNLGNIYQDLKDYSSAELWYKKAIERENAIALKNIGLLYHNDLKNDLYASAYYIALIGTGYTKGEIITFLKKEWKIPNETIKKGYELQLKMEGLPKRYTGDLNLE
ncbi:MAG: sel1 repeat family protein [Arcobacter sp.]|nr:MAG: sel1 repeat family protein [Arcobacter sp.]